MCEREIQGREVGALQALKTLPLLFSLYSFSACCRIEEIRATKPRCSPTPSARVMSNILLSRLMRSRDFEGERIVRTRQESLRSTAKTWLCAAGLPNKLVRQENCEETRDGGASTCRCRQRVWGQMKKCPNRTRTNNAACLGA